MKSIILLTSLLLFTHITHAKDCFDMAGEDYKIDPDLLRAISWNESRFNKKAIGANPTTGYGSGLMQVDSQHLPELKKYGIKPEHLVNDACMNIYTGAYYLAISFKKWGVSWVAIGAYNAGFAKTEKQAMKRYRYAEKIHATYLSIKYSQSKSVNTAVE